MTVKNYKIIRWTKTGKKYPVFVSSDVKVFGTTPKEYLECVNMLKMLNKTALPTTHYTMNEIV